MNICSFINAKLNSSPYKVSEQLYFSTPLVVDWPDSSWTLEKIDESLERQNSVGLVSHLLDSQLRVAFNSAIAAQTKGTCIDLGSMKESVCPPIPLDHVLSGISLDLKDAAEKVVLKDQTTVYRRVPPPPNNFGTIEFYFSKKKGDSESTSVARADLRVVTFQVKRDFFVKDWVRTLPGQFPELVNGDTKIVLPRLKQVWDEIARMTIPDAAQFLTAKEGSTRRSVSAFGISVDETLLVTIGPCMIFFVSLYLLAELRNLNQVLTRGTGESKSIAWIGAYEEPLSRWVSALSLVALPIGTSATLAAKTESLFTVRTVLAWTMTLGIAIVAVFTLVTVGRIRSLLFPPTQPKVHEDDG